jgi:hypothetical protein
MAAPTMTVDYPVRFEVQYPEDGNRFLILVRWLLAIPHLIVLYFLQIVASLVTFIAWFAILFTGGYPEGMFRFVVGYQRWNNNVIAYILFHDGYPPFTMDDGEYAPMSYDVERQDRYSRLLIFVKWLLAIPHFLILIALGIAAEVLFLVMVVVVLVTGSYPRGMFDFIVGVGRWGARVNAYVLLLTDRYPPFSMR